MLFGTCSSLCRKEEDGSAQVTIVRLDGQSCGLSDRWCFGLPPDMPQERQRGQPDDPPMPRTTTRAISLDEETDVDTTSNPEVVTEDGAPKCATPPPAGRAVTQGGSLDMGAVVAKLSRLSEDLELNPELALEDFPQLVVAVPATWPGQGSSVVGAHPAGSCGLAAAALGGKAAVGNRSLSVEAVQPPAQNVPEEPTQATLWSASQRGQLRRPCPPAVRAASADPLPPHVHLRPAKTFRVRPISEGLADAAPELESFRCPEGGALKLTRIGAMLEKWNAAHRHLEARPGDFVVQVGGVAGAPQQLRAALEEATRVKGCEVELTVKRVVGQTMPVPSASQVKPPSRTLLQRLSSRGGGFSKLSKGSTASVSSTASTAAAPSSAVSELSLSQAPSSTA